MAWRSASRQATPDITDRGPAPVTPTSVGVAYGLSGLSGNASPAAGRLADPEPGSDRVATPGNRFVTQRERPFRAAFIASQKNRLSEASLHRAFRS